MSLSSFVAKYPGGRSQLARDLGVTSEAVRLWETGDRTPSSTNMRKLMAVSGGKVKPADFYREAA